MNIRRLAAAAITVTLTTTVLGASAQADDDQRLRPRAQMLSGACRGLGTMQVRVARTAHGNTRIAYSGRVPDKAR